MGDRIEDGGTAFPSRIMYRDSQGIDHEIVNMGMSLRDWFAGQALSGLIGHVDKFGVDAPAVAAEAAYEAADAMMAAREGGAA